MDGEQYHDATSKSVLVKLRRDSCICSSIGSTTSVMSATVGQPRRNAFVTLPRNCWGIAAQFVPHCHVDWRQAICERLCQWWDQTTPVHGPWEDEILQHFQDDEAQIRRRRLEHHDPCDPDFQCCLLETVTTTTPDRKDEMLQHANIERRGRRGCL